ncbi:hypothetical protein A0H81_13862 [Grifola frondosa]|uniref:Nitrogen regulatory protein areA GATA-like domain-containing protein n=1 Tax=Grifola frondosa TaxID=5627 RepID=A0A1C7LNN1_GRIFR|nr:hypothetical protein A0H81_13862 [Grifola frondosa]
MAGLGSCCFSECDFCGCGVRPVLQPNREPGAFQQTASARLCQVSPLFITNGHRLPPAPPPAVPPSPTTALVVPTEAPHRHRSSPDRYQPSPSLNADGTRFPSYLLLLRLNPLAAATPPALVSAFFSPRCILTLSAIARTIMIAHFPSPILSVAADAVKDLEGEDALSGLWALFTKCKESLKDGRRLENISWRLWYREMAASHHSPSSSPGPYLHLFQRNEVLLQSRQYRKMASPSSKHKYADVARAHRRYDNGALLARKHPYADRFLRWSSTKHRERPHGANKVTWLSGRRKNDSGHLTGQARCAAALAVFLWGGPTDAATHRSAATRSSITHGPTPCHTPIWCPRVVVVNPPHIPPLRLPRTSPIPPRRPQPLRTD